MGKSPQESYTSGGKIHTIFLFFRLKVHNCTTRDVIFIDWVKKWQGVFVSKWL